MRSPKGMLENSTKPGISKANAEKRR